MFWKRRKLKYESVLNKGDDDVEVQTITKKNAFSPSCMRTALWTGLLISIYFAPSIGLTFYQSWLLRKFRFPLSIVSVHMTVKYLLAMLVRTCIACKQGKPRMTIPFKENLQSIAPTGIFSGIDIGFSNWGLELITISLYTMTKSTAIIFILGFAMLFKLEKKTWSICIIVVMISLGLFLFTYKATNFNIFGFVLLLIASMSSGLRWTCMQLVLQKSKLGMKDPIDMIYFMQPWMFISVLPFAILIEGGRIYQNAKLFPSEDYPEYLMLFLKVLAGAFIAFFMELCEVLVVTYTSSLTLSVAGIFKELLILVLAVLWNGDTMSAINVGGLFLCLGGIICHVIHKIKTTNLQQVSHGYDYDSDKYELGKSLMDNTSSNLYFSSDSEAEHSDTQELFNILNRHDR